MKKSMKMFTRVMAVFGLLVAVSAQAGTVTWEVFDITNDVGNVSTNGTLVVAKSGGASSWTVNGVTFAGTNTMGVAGNLFDSLYSNDSIGGRGYGNVVSNTSYRSLLGSGQRSGRSGINTWPAIASTQVWTTINLTNLTVGATYQIQIWASDVDNVAGTARKSGLVLGDGSASGPVYGTDAILYKESVDAPAGTWGTAGQYGIGTFVADATTQNINVRSINNLLTTPAWSNSDHFSNGWQLRQVPSGIPTVPGSLIYGK